MSKETARARVYIIGAGVSGLVTAINLEKLGYAPIILESSGKTGGRVKTDLVEGYQLDHGFQVLLEAYPLAKKYLDYAALDLQRLLPGALIYRNQKSYAFGDPLRKPSFLLPTALSPVASLKDKIKIFQLLSSLRTRDMESLFSDEEKSTLDYLKGYGFSDKVITNFFRPFFAGIFLEPDLETSSREFAFVYKCFGQGNAVIPKAGMGAIPAQLAGMLQHSTVKLNCKVHSIDSQHITLVNDEQLPYDFAVIATDPSGLVQNYTTATSWKGCDNLYFTQPARSIKKPVIALNASQRGYVNNIFYSSSLATVSQGKDELLSVTVVKDHIMPEEELIARVTEELASVFGITGLTFLKRYRIDRALPDISNLQYSQEATETLLTDKIALAGDHLLNGSLNAAMKSGETAAAAAHRVLTDSLLTTG